MPTASEGNQAFVLFACDQRVAMRQGSSTLYWLLADHLGSTSLATNDSGAVHSRQLYYPYCQASAENNYHSSHFAGLYSRIPLAQS